jgi:hypothetical protein
LGISPSVAAKSDSSVGLIFLTVGLIFGWTVGPSTGLTFGLEDIGLDDGLFIVLFGGLLAAWPALSSSFNQLKRSGSVGWMYPLERVWPYATD